MTEPDRANHAASPTPPSLGRRGPWLAAGLPYLAVGAGLYLAHSAWLAMLGYQAVMLAYIWRFRPADPGVQGPRDGLYRWLPGLMVVGSILVGVPLRLLWPWFGESADLAAALAGWGLTPESWWPFALWLCLFNPWLEQHFWRGVLGSASPRPAPTDAWFAGYHLLVVVTVAYWYWLPLVFGGLVLASWWWRQVIRVEGRFRGATIAHFVADLSILVALGLVYNQPDAFPDLAPGVGALLGLAR